METEIKISEKPTKKELETDLYVFRNTEPGFYEKFEFLIKDFENYLSRFPAFIGITPFGSTVAGYGAASSDIDLFILYDPKKFSDTREERSFLCDIEDKCKKYKKIVGREVSFFTTKVFAEQTISVNKKRLIAPWVAMSRAVFGPRVEEYRNLFREYLQNQPNDLREQIIIKVMEGLAQSDLDRLPERQERLPDISREEHKTILEKRKTLWAQRVRKIWGVGD